MKEEYKYHHVVPEYYLKNFSEDGKGVFVYDKIVSKDFPQSISKILGIDDFYRIDEQLIPENLKGVINPLSIERDFLADDIEYHISEYIKSLIPIFDNLIKNKHSGISYMIDDGEIEALAITLFLQYVRTPEMRDYLLNSRNETNKYILSELESRFGEGNDFIKGLKLQIERNNELSISPVLYHLSMTFGNDTVIKKIVKDLCENIWQLYISDEDYFYTCDSPIILEGFVDGAVIKDIGLNVYGGVITFPLTKKVLVKVFDKEYYADYKKRDRRIHFVDNQFVQIENLRQYVWAKRKVVSSTRNFNLIKEIIEMVGEEVFFEHNLYVSPNNDDYKRIIEKIKTKYGAIMNNTFRKREIPL